VPQELIDKIFSKFTLSSAISAKSSCKLFARSGPPLCRLTTEARKQSLLVFDLRYKNEKRSRWWEQLYCSYCKDLHDPIMFSERDHAESTYRRHFKDCIYHVELNPHWFMSFRQLGNLIAATSPYVTPSGPANFWTLGWTDLNPPNYGQDDINIMLRHGKSLLTFSPTARERCPKKNFSLPAVPVDLCQANRLTCSFHFVSPRPGSAEAITPLFL